MKTPITILALLVALAALSAPALAQSAETGLPHRIDYKLDLRFFARGEEISNCTIYLYPGSVSTMITGEHIGTGQAGGRPDTKYSTYVTVAALDPEAAPASIARTHSAELAVYNASARFQIGEIYLDRGDTATAEASFRQALAIDPGSVLALHALARAHIGSSQFLPAEWFPQNGLPGSP